MPLNNYFSDFSAFLVASAVSAFFALAVVGLDLPIGEKEISVGEFYENGTKVRDFYSGLESIVINGTIKINTQYTILLIVKL